MRDPFRPNSNRQLIREAQIAFVVITALACVLAYLAFYRMTGRRFQFRQIAQTAPLAQHIDDTAYPAQTLLDQEAQIVQGTLNSIRNAVGSSPTNHPSNQKPSPPATTLSRALLPHQQPPAKSQKQLSPDLLLPPTRPIETLPVEQAAIAASVPVVPTPSVAQAQFIAPTESKPIPNTTSPNLSEKLKPDSDDPFEKIKTDTSWLTPVRPLSKKKDVSKSVSPKAHDYDVENLKPVVDDDTQPNFQPPLIRSNFGAGSTRELPSFDAPIKKEEFRKAKNPIPTQLRPALGNTQKSAFTVKPKPTPPAAHAFESRKELVAKQNDKTFPNLRPQETVTQFPIIQKLGNQKSIGPDEYQIQATDSLWSIAVDHYGDGRFFRALHEHNLERITSVDNLPPNTAINVPDVDELLKRYPQLCPSDKFSDNDGTNASEESKADYDLYEQSMFKRFHVTKAGDTLFDVARQRLGQASRYLEIFELNRFRIPQDVNHLTPLDPGLRLLLPE